MIELPKTTEFNKRIPKQKFYENLSITPALKRQFTENIRLIYWRNKIAVSTMNLLPGKDVTEIEVFLIHLNTPELDEAVLRQIDKEIPYHILFLLEYDNRYQAWIGYKENSAGVNAFNVSKYYHTDWMSEDELSISADGITADDVYENFVRQLAGGALQPDNDDETLQESILRNEKKTQLEKQIAALQAKIRREKQLNKQVQMNAELKKLKAELKNMKNNP
ncbi:MAG: DUF4391 domain-containing protein [Clostridiales bacterium]|nr:DUF4391 domain-containing protein [Clostridiales bacterium]